MIELHGLTKRYGPTLAVDDLSFQVQSGKVTGFLGPNGAGKSTSMRMVLGLDRPTAGQALVDGRPYQELRAPLRVVGALLDAGAVHPRRSARSHLLALAVSNGIARARVEEVLGLVGLDKVGSIRTTLAATPARWAVLTAKAAVVGAVTFPAGFVVTALATLAASAILGTGTDGIGAVSARSAAALTLTSLLVVGLGAVLRSAAGTITTAVAVLFAPPILGALVSNEVVAAVLDHLPAGLSGVVASGAGDRYSPEVAALLLGAWAVGSLALGVVTLHRRHPLTTKEASAKPRPQVGDARRRPSYGRSVHMDTTRRTARLAGVLFIITFVTSIPAALLLYTPVLEDASYIVGGGAADAGVALGAFLEVLLIVANVGTAVVLFPVLKRQSEPLALGYVSARLVECTFIAIGIVSLLSVLTLRQDFAGAGGDPGTFETVGQSLVAIHDWTFLLGPGFIVGVGNGLILGWLMYRSGLVPRGMALLGLVAGPVLLAGGTAALLGIIEPDSALKNLAAGPEFVWELSLGIYLMVKGFKPSPITTGMAAASAPPAYHDVDA